MGPVACANNRCPYHGASQARYSPGYGDLADLPHYLPTADTVAEGAPPEGPQPAADTFLPPVPQTPTRAPAGDLGPQHPGPRKDFRWLRWLGLARWCLPSCSLPCSSAASWPFPRTHNGAHAYADRRGHSHVHAGPHVDPNANSGSYRNSCGHTHGHEYAACRPGRHGHPRHRDREWDACRRGPHCDLCFGNTGDLGLNQDRGSGLKTNQYRFDLQVLSSWNGQRVSAEVEGAPLGGPPPAIISPDTARQVDLDVSTSVLGSMTIVGLVTLNGSPAPPGLPVAVVFPDGMVIGSAKTGDCGQARSAYRLDLQILSGWKGRTALVLAPEAPGEPTIRVIIQVSAPNSAVSANVTAESA